MQTFETPPPHIGKTFRDKNNTYRNTILHILAFKNFKSIICTDYKIVSRFEENINCKFYKSFN